MESEFRESCEEKVKIEVRSQNGDNWATDVPSRVYKHLTIFDLKRIILRLTGGRPFWIVEKGCENHFKVSEFLRSGGQVHISLEFSDQVTF